MRGAQRVIVRERELQQEWVSITRHALVQRSTGGTAWDGAQSVEELARLDRSLRAVRTKRKRFVSCAQSLSHGFKSEVLAPVVLHFE